MLGFALYLVVPHLHHVGTIAGACDIVAVPSTSAGAGLRGRLMEVAEPFCGRAAQHTSRTNFVCCMTRSLCFRSWVTLLEQTYLKELK